jgi:hypothetical protein
MTNHGNCSPKKPEVRLNMPLLCLIKYPDIYITGCNGCKFYIAMLTPLGYRLFYCPKIRCPLLPACLPKKQSANFLAAVSKASGYVNGTKNNPKHTDASRLLTI